MTTERRSRITVSGIPVEVVRKDIKNLHIAVYPPAGRVRVAAPGVMTIAAIRLAVIYRLTWIKKQRLSFQKQERLPPPEYVTGESHFFRGRRYRLKVVSSKEKPCVRIRRGYMELVTPRASRARRQEIIQRFYREELKKAAQPLVDKWTNRMKTRTPRYAVKLMRKNWGTYSRRTHQIWLNLELAKKPVRCLEYIIVHEMVHAVVPNHGEKFMALMNKHLPGWEALRGELNKGALGHELSE